MVFTLDVALELGTIKVNFAQVSRAVPLGLIVEMVDQECAAQQIRRAQHRFSRRAVRERTKWGDTQLKIHLARLTELEYLLIHRGGRGQSFEYELLYDGAAHGVTPHVSGLIDVEALRQACGAQHYDAERSGSDALQSALGRGVVGGQSGPGRDGELALIADETVAKCDAVPELPETHGTGNGAQVPSYVPLVAHA